MESERERERGNECVCLEESSLTRCLDDSLIDFGTWEYVCMCVLCCVAVCLKSFSPCLKCTKFATFDFDELHFFVLGYFACLILPWINYLFRGELLPLFVFFNLLPHADAGTFVL